jgi:uncharacterized protein (DUF488 family)
MDGKVTTIGHSNHHVADFLRLLHDRGVSALCDVRSVPYSRHNPPFTRENLVRTLEQSGIRYLFLGKELGARTTDESCYLDGTVQYDRIARTALFRSGLERVLRCMETDRTVLMCAEGDPIRCHRAMLTSRHLAAAQVDVRHILRDGSVETHGEAMARLLVELGMSESDLFRSPTEQLEEAYRVQSQRIAYRK